MNIFGFKISFSIDKLKEKAAQVVEFVKTKVLNVKSKLHTIDLTKLDDIFQEGAAEAINKARINYTHRMEDILQGWHIREAASGLTGKRTFEIYHSFLLDKDKRYSVTIRGKEYRTYGKKILLSLEKGRSDYWIFPKEKGRNKRLVWGYPTLRVGMPKNSKVAKAVFVPKQGMYEKGIGMIKAGKAKLMSYFKSRNISVTIKTARMRGF